MWVWQMNENILTIKFKYYEIKKLDNQCIDAVKRL